MLNKLIYLVETRGYAKTQYIHVIKKIIKYISDKLSNEYSQDSSQYKFEIPEEYTTLIDIVSNLSLTVYVQDIPDAHSANLHSGAGQRNVFYDTKIVNNKLDKAEIEIYAFSHNGRLLPRTVFNSLSHELNHLYEEYSRLQKTNNNFDLYLSVSDTENILRSHFSNDPEINNLFREIFYRLFTYSETNALINSVYADLDSLNSDRDNFKNDLYQTQAYYIYKTIKNNYKLFSKIISDDDWVHVHKVYNTYASRKIRSLDNFKKFFNSFLTRRLNFLLRGIGRVASLYYDAKNDIRIIDTPYFVQY